MSRNESYDCAKCGVRHLCLASGLSTDQQDKLREITKNRKHVSAGQPIYEQEDAFSSIFVMISGASKSVVRQTNGKMSISHITLRGDFMGFPGAAYGAMPESQIALQDSVLCVISYRDLMAQMRREPLVGIQFHEAIARTSIHQQAMNLAISSPSADGKVRGFLHWFMQQLSMRGYYHHDFTLPLTREELANILGLRLETVSRAFSQLERRDFLKISGRRVQVMDSAALES